MNHKHKQVSAKLPGEKRAHLRGPCNIGGGGRLGRWLGPGPDTGFMIETWAVYHLPAGRKQFLTGPCDTLYPQSCHEIAPQGPCRAGGKLSGSKMTATSPQEVVT